MKKRKLLIIGGIAVILVSATVITVNAVVQRSNQDKLADLGGAEASVVMDSEEATGEVIIQGDNFTVKESEIQQAVKRNEVLTDGTSKYSEEEAAESIARQKSVYQIALKAGYEEGEEKIIAFIKQDRENIEKTSNYQDFLVYLEAMSVTPDEYWEQMKTDENYRINMVVHYYISDQQDLFMEKEGFASKDEEFYEAWNKQLDTITDEALKQESAKVVTKNKTYGNVDLFSEDGIVS